MLLSNVMLWKISKTLCMSFPRPLAQLDLQRTNFPVTSLVISEQQRDAWIQIPRIFTIQSSRGQAFYAVGNNRLVQQSQWRSVSYRWEKCRENATGRVVCNAGFPSFCGLERVWFSKLLQVVTVARQKRRLTWTLHTWMGSSKKVLCWVLAWCCR